MIGNSEIICQGLGTWTTLPGCVLGKFYFISADLLDILASTLLHTWKMLQSPWWLEVLILHFNFDPHSYLVYVGSEAIADQFVHLSMLAYTFVGHYMENTKTDMC